MASLGAEALDALAATWPDGRIKQAVIARTLAVRRAAPRLFSEGSYVPIDAEGPLARHVLAFARTLDDAIAITVVRRLTFGLLADEGLSIQRLRWSGTRLRLPLPYRNLQLRDVIAGTKFAQTPEDLAAMLAGLPVALLVSQPLVP
jgi:(1->4)-alpha-D-glucan 1-alpha-D-glucosylmutase